MKIKICGITKPEEASYLIDNKVDFAGVVMFFQKSKRNVSEKQAAEVLKAFKSASCQSEADTHNIKIVAVTVSPSLNQVKAIENLGFDYIQIHGELSEEIINEAKIPIFRAFNVSDLDKYDYYLSFKNIAGFVFDAGEPGSGKTFDWDMLKDLKREKDRLYILAGGLNSENVKRAIEAVRPDGVDVSSAVEICSERPDKDKNKIDGFVNAVRS